VKVRALLEDHESGVRDPAFHLFDVVRRALVVPAHRPQCRYRDVTEPIEDVPVLERPDEW
jgi:hypothetical protein